MVIQGNQRRPRAVARARLTSAPELTGTVEQMSPNPPFITTAASVALAVPSSLGSSAAAQRER
jgi:hypothetical protein